MIEVARPQALVGASQARGGLRVKQARAAPVAAFPVLREHPVVDERVDVDSRDQHATHLPTGSRKGDSNP